MFGFTKFATILSVAAAVVASPLDARQGQCNTGPVNCCNSVSNSADPSTAGLLSLLGVVLGDVAVPVHLQCSPLAGILGGASGCQSQPVCCENNHFNGLINVGCSPIAL